MRRAHIFTDDSSDIFFYPHSDVSAIKVSAASFNYAIDNGLVQKFDETHYVFTPKGRGWLKALKAEHEREIFGR